MSRCRIRIAVLAVFTGLATSFCWAPPAVAACAPNSKSDFNGDGYSDTVVADPWATVAGLQQAGRIHVLYGDSDRRIGEGGRGIVQQGASSVTDRAEANDRFGFALAVADIDCDANTDLVVGAPYEDIDGHIDSGLVQIIWGSRSGLGQERTAQELTQQTFGNAVVAGDQFGYAVDALENVDQGGTTPPASYALAIGAPGVNVGAAVDAGWVGFQVASDGDNVEIQATQDTPGISDEAESGDRFGAAVSMVYLSDPDTSFVGAVIGTPNEDVGLQADAGAITVIGGLYFPGEAMGGVTYDQNSPGVPGTAEAGDVFGRSLDTIKVGSISRVAVGVPGEDLGSNPNAGAVQLFSSTTGALTPGVFLSQDTAGVSGAAESGDGFGNKLAFAAPGLGDSLTRLGVSVPSEDGAARDSGRVQVFPVTDIDAETSYAQESPGIPGAAEAGDRFGATLAFVSGAAERAFIVGVPDDVSNSTGMVNVIPLGGGVPRYWKPGVGGLPRAGSSRFGDALGSVDGATT